MDKVYIDGNNKSTVVELPKHGEVRLIVQEGKVIRLETKTSQKV